MPCAAIIPWMSSGVVSQRTRTTASPAPPRSAAVSASKTTAPHAAPGEAFSPFAAGSSRASGSMRGWSSWSSDVGSMRATPSSRVISPSSDHRDGRLERGRGGALRAARLEEEELALLDGELDVLHVAVVPLERGHRFDELRERVGKHLLHLLEPQRRADARDDVLALRVRQELAVEPLLARRRIAREADAGRRRLALVPEDHLHDVHGGAEVLGDVVRAPVHLRARVVPRLEDAADRARQLVARVLRERVTRLLLVDRLEHADEPAQVVGVELVVLLDALRAA